MTATKTCIATLDALDAAARDGFLTALIDESRSHPALNHPWLTAVAAGDFPNMTWALRDYAWHCQGYSQWFPHYLKGVIHTLGRENPRVRLEENLKEENGVLGLEDQAALREVGIEPASVNGVPHQELFRRFCRAMGLHAGAIEDIAPATERWRNRFGSYLSYVVSASPAAAVGALGLGTENVVQPIYQQILAGIQKIPFLTRRDYVFFELHCLVDNQHLADLLAVSRELAGTAETRKQLRQGMLTALDLRCELWDVLYHRATSYQHVSSA